MTKGSLPLVFVVLWPGLAAGQAEAPLLLQNPAVSRSHVAFVYAGDLWVVGREGGDARRLTSGVGLETHPVFSPDGTRIAFAGEYGGGLNVYVVPAAGGVPERLTYHPGPDIPVGWTPDGRKVLFRSRRYSYGRFSQLFTVPLTGGLPVAVPLPMAEQGSFSPDGRRIAYVPFTHRSPFPGFLAAWKRYRGGLAAPVWIADLSDSAIEKVPRTDSCDDHPMWVGDRVYFLSDRNGPVTLFVYEPATKQVRQVLDNHGPDIKSAAACADAIVYDRLGELYLFDLKTEKARRLEVRAAGDLAGVRPRMVKVAKKIQNAGLSPTGARAVFEARGEILTVPAEKGDIRNLTHTPGVAERDPAWSPDGKWLAYFSDASGEYQLHVKPQNGLGTPRAIPLGDAPSFYYTPVWSPDGKRIAYTDKRLNFWYVELATGKSTKVDTSTYADMAQMEAPVWSPDGRWLAYVKQLKNYLYTVFLHSLDTGKSRQLTDGMSDAHAAVFDKNGKYLYFLASTDVGPTLGSGMSVFNRAVTRSPYVVVLSKDEPSPLAHESDEEKEPEAAAEKDKEKKEKEKREKEKEGAEAVKVRIDLEDIDQRILALPLPARNYTGLLAGQAGTLFLLEGPAVFNWEDAGVVDLPQQRLQPLRGPGRQGGAPQGRADGGRPGGAHGHGDAGGH